VGRAITLHYQTGFAAVEVGDITTELMLAPKFEALQLSIPKQLPEQVLGRRPLCSQFARQFCQCCQLIAAPIVSGFFHFFENVA
jgi:hypothetical protein